MFRVWRGRWLSLGRTLLSLCLWAVPVVYLLYSLVILIFVTRHSYAGVLQFYSRTWPHAFDVEAISRDCFTESWYYWINRNSGWLIGMIAGVLGFYFVYSRSISRQLSGLVSDTIRALRFLVRTFMECSPRQKVSLLLLFGALAGYWIYIYAHYPLYADEACAYVYFVRQGFFLTTICYPIPNNHIFFDIVCGWLDKLSFLGPTVVMRIPSMVAGCVMYYVIFCLFKRWGDFRRAMAVVAGVAFCHILSFYATQGRGYQLQLLFTVISAVSAWAYWFSPQWRGRSGYGLFIVSSVLGFYINPLFVFHFLAMCLIGAAAMLKQTKDGRKKDGRERDGGDGKGQGGETFLRAIFIVVGLTAILYLPLILGSSWKSILGNRDTGSGSWHRIASEFGIFLYDIKYDFYYGYAALCVVPAAIVVSLFFYYRGKIGGYFYKWGLYYFVASVLSVTIIILYMRMYPLERTLCFLVLAMNIIFVNVVYDTFRVYFLRRAMLLLVAFLLVKDAVSMRLLFWDRFLLRNDINVIDDIQKKRDFEQLSRLRPGSWQITDSEDDWVDHLRIYLTGHGQPEHVFYNRKEALGDIVFIRAKYLPFFDLKGYTAWGHRMIPAGDSGSLYIYVSPKLLYR
jgi:hypothetical protein